MTWYEVHFTLIGLLLGSPWEVRFRYAIERSNSTTRYAVIKYETVALFHRKKDAEKHCRKLNGWD